MLGRIPRAGEALQIDEVSYHACSRRLLKSGFYNAVVGAQDDILGVLG